MKTYENILRAARSLGLSLKTSATSEKADEVAVLAGTGAPSGATYGGQTLETGQTAFAYRQDATDTDAAMYLTLDGGTTWVALTLSALAATEFAAAVMDDTDPPTASAGRGFVDGSGGELLIEAQAVADLTVRSQTGGNTISGQGDVNNVSAFATLSGFGIPVGAGEQSKDIIVIAADGTVTVRAGTEGAAPASNPTLTSGDVPLARVTLTEGVDTTIQAGNIDDLRERQSIDGGKLIALSVLTAAINDLAVTTGKIAANAVTDAKLATDVLKVSSGTIATGDVQTMNATPVEMIAAPGAGLYIEVESIHWFLDYGTAAYDAAAAGDTLAAKYTDGSGDATCDLVAGDAIGAASADYHTMVTAVAELIPVANAAIVAHINTGEWYGAAGDSPLKWEARYRIRTLAFA